MTTPLSTPPAVARLPLATRAGMRLRHGVRLFRELSAYAVEQRLWWLVPMVLVLLLVALLVTTTHTVVPVAVYTLF